MSDHDNRINEAENTILLVKSMGAGSSSNDSTGKPGFMDALETLIDNLRKECYAKFTDREDSNKLRKRVEQLEDRLERVDDDFKNLKTSQSVCRDITDQNTLDIQELKKGIKDL